MKVWLSRLIAKLFYGRGLSKYRIFRATEKRLTYTPTGGFVDYARVGKYNMQLGTGSMSKFIASTGMWEPFETRLLKRIVKRGMRVVDAGANIGYYTLLAADLVGKEGMVYAFEPSPKPFEILSRNLKENKIYNAFAVPMALSNKQGQSRFYVNDRLEGYDSVSKATPKGREILVASISLDKYLRGASVDFIKIDVQGAELKVLKGMKKIIENSPNLQMFIEYSPDWLTKSGTKPADLLSWLQNYFTIKVMNSGRGKLASISDYPLKDALTVNLYCKRRIVWQTS